MWGGKTLVYHFWRTSFRKTKMIDNAKRKGIRLKKFVKTKAYEKSETLTLIQDNIYLTMNILVKYICTKSLCLHHCTCFWLLIWIIKLHWSKLSVIYYDNWCLTDWWEITLQMIKHSWNSCDLGLGFLIYWQVNNVQIEYRLCAEGKRTILALHLIDVQKRLNQCNLLTHY